MGMTRVYGISSNLYSNVCESDDPADIAKWFTEEVKKLPISTVIFIRIKEVPDEIWNSYSKFEGFKHVRTEDVPGSD